MIRRIALGVVILTMAINPAGLMLAQEEGSGGGAADTPTATSPTVLITGSNRGIGLEFAREYAKLGWRVIATCRTPAEAADLKSIAASHPNVVIEQLDITDHAQIDALATKYSTRAIDLLLNNAALLSARPQQAFGHAACNQLRILRGQARKFLFVLGLQRG